MKKRLNFIIFYCLFTSGFLYAQNLSSSDTSLKFRTISKELTVSPQQEIYFLNIGRPFRVRQWNEAYIKVVARVATNNMDSYTDAQLFDALKIFFEETSAGQTIMSYSGTSLQGAPGAVGTGGEKEINTVRQDEVMKRLEYLLAQKRKNISSITHNPGFEIFVPATAKLTIDNSFSRIELEDNMNNVRLFLNAATVEGKNIDTLEMRSTLSNIRLEDINVAGLELNNDNFNAGKIQYLDLGSASSTINYSNGRVLKIMSRRDKITAGNIKVVEGIKHFGELRIGQLQENFNLQGQNADVYIGQLAGTVRSVYIKNSWANLRLPLNDLKSYKLSFTGYATVFAPFAFEFTRSEPDEPDKRYFNYKTGAAPNIPIEIICPKCSVDFK